MMKHQSARSMPAVISAPRYADIEQPDQTQNTSFRTSSHQQNK